MLYEQDRVMGYQIIPVVSGEVQKTMTAGADPNFDNLPKGVDDDGHWEFDGALGG